DRYVHGTERRAVLPDGTTGGACASDDASDDEHRGYEQQPRQHLRSSTGLIFWERIVMHLIARATVLSGILVALSACSAYPRTEADFGNSVRHMVSSQRVVTGPVDPDPVETGDGQRLNSV